MNLLPYRAKSFFENAEVVEHLHADVYTRMKAFFRQHPESSGHEKTARDLA